MQKIAFLFLIISNIYHERLWRDFFKNHEAQYELYIHSKYPVRSRYLKTYELPIKIPTTWENTMHAQIALLKAALKDKDNSIFIFLSESTLPLCPFSKVYNSLILLGMSQFEYMLNPHIYVKGRNLKPIPEKKQYKSSQWIILNRKHAQLIANDNYYIAIMSRYFADNEHLAATLLEGHALLPEVLKKDRTLVIWPSFRAAHPYIFTDLADPVQWKTIADAIKKGYFFARKFAPTCRVMPLERELEKQRKQLYIKNS